MKIVADANIPLVESYFAHAGELILKSGRDISRHEVLDADVLLVRSITKVNEALLAGTRVKFVGSVTAGMDHVDLEWLKKQGITYAFATGFNAPPVADYVVSAIAALQQQHRLARTFKAAVIGVGNVGRLVVKHLEAIGAEVIVCDPLRAESEPSFQSTPLSVIQNVDLISLHVPLTKNSVHPTYHFIDKHFLARQQSRCVVINASRGGVVATETLLAEASRLTLCLDVFEHEPQINPALLQAAVIATPHIAGYSVQSKLRGVEMIYQAACQAGLIQPSVESDHVLPHRDVMFANKRVAWQDVVLEVFNPLIMTQQMRLLLNDASALQRFDQLRNEFQGRHEFAYSHLREVDCSSEDMSVLKRLGFN